MGRPGLMITGRERRNGIDRSVPARCISPGVKRSIKRSLTPSGSGTSALCKRFESFFDGRHA